MIHKHDDGVEEWTAFFNDPEGRPLAIMSVVGAAAIWAVGPKVEPTALSRHAAVDVFDFLLLEFIDGLDGNMGDTLNADYPDWVAFAEERSRDCGALRDRFFQTGWHTVEAKLDDWLFDEPDDE